MKLHELQPGVGSTSDRKRKGRGHGSGNGKTAGRGHKGQNARSGGGVRIGFEGGQMPIYRRLPKRGFNNVFALKFAEINVSDLEKYGMKEVCLACLKEAGKVRNSAQALRVLGNGELNSAVTVKAAHFTASAKEKIEKAGGKAELV